MSIKSIDSQIMIARTADFSRDASALQKRPEIAQDQLAFREKINDAQDQSRVAKALKTEMSKLRPDEDGGGGSAGYGDGSDGEPGGNWKENETDMDMFVPPGDNVIDIKV